MAKYLVVEGTIVTGEGSFGPGSTFSAEDDDVAGVVRSGRVRALDPAEENSKEYKDELIANSKYAPLGREELFQILADRGRVASKSCSNKTLIGLLEKLDAGE
jgi:hypothetical protein